MPAATGRNERAELHRQIWAIADDLRGAVDGWNFMSYVLGTLFYRFISEKIELKMNERERRATRNAAFSYAEPTDAQAEAAREVIVNMLGFYIAPSHLFKNVCAGAAGEVGYSPVEFWAADDCYYIQCGEDLDDRFVFYCVFVKQSFLQSKVRKASVPRLARSFVESLIIPVPPLPVQQEIVRRLDAMTGLIRIWRRSWRRGRGSTSGFAKRPSSSWRRKGWSGRSWGRWFL